MTLHNGGGFPAWNHQTEDMFLRSEGGEHRGPALPFCSILLRDFLWEFHVEGSCGNRLYFGASLHGETGSLPPVPWCQLSPCMDSEFPATPSLPKLSFQLVPVHLGVRQHSGSPPPPSLLKHKPFRLRLSQLCGQVTLCLSDKTVFHPLYLLCPPFPCLVIAKSSQFSRSLPVTLAQMPRGIIFLPSLPPSVNSLPSAPDYTA